MHESNLKMVLTDQQVENYAGDEVVGGETRVTTVVLLLFFHVGTEWLPYLRRQIFLVQFNERPT